MIFSHEDGKLITTPAPFSPSKDFILGSDDMGRDIYAYIIFGTRLTILLGVFVALGRFIIALPIALFAGFGNKTAKGVIKVFGVLFSAIPAVLISLIVLKMNFFVKLDRESSIMAFVLVLSLVGWPKISRLIMERVQSKQPALYKKRSCNREESIQDCTRKCCSASCPRTNCIAANGDCKVTCNHYDAWSIQCFCWKLKIC